MLETKKHRPCLLYYDMLSYCDTVRGLLEEHFQVITLPDPSYDTDDILKTVEVCMAPLGFKFDRAKIDKCPKLKVIASSTLSVPHIETDYAMLKGIGVCSLSNEKEFMKSITPTSELTWGLIIALTRRIPWAHKMVCSGQWNGRELGRKTPKMLSRMNLGIIGLGRLGSLVAAYGKAFGMRVYYYSPTSRDDSYERCENLSDLAACSDIVSVHAHLTPQTVKIINMDFIQAMRPGSFIINTARGALIDESALLNALQSGHLGGAALDVLAEEYELDFKASLKNSPLVEYAKSHDNLIITPHYAGATIDAWEKTQMRFFDLLYEAINVKNH
ncbi:MAG: hydroxyacid dehydrogenase [Nitrospirae bacterium]|nr:hydroxyacid dehydrogenase [Nitrospirota bacterium]